MFGIGIIGCGKIAQVRHIPEYAEHKDAKLVGFYDINQERAATLAAQHGGTAYATVEELLANPDIDAVSVCAANFAHAELHKFSAKEKPRKPLWYRGFLIIAVRL